MKCPDMSRGARLTAHGAVSTSLALCSDRVLRELVDTAVPIGSGIGGKAGQPAAAVSERLRGLERAGRMMSAARAAALSALRAGRGYEDDGQAGLKPWQQHLLGVSAEQARRDGLRAARLADYPCLWQALADATISESIADRILAWVARLPRRVEENQGYHRDFLPRS